MSEQTTREPHPVIILAAIALLAAGVAFWPDNTAPFGQGAAPVPTLMPTPAIIVPTPAPAPTMQPAAPVVVERVDQGGQVVINNSTTSVDVDVCISLFCR